MTAGRQEKKHFLLEKSMIESIKSIILDFQEIHLEIFNTYLTSIMTLGSKISMVYPFPLLQIHGLKQVISEN